MYLPQVFKQRLALFGHRTTMVVLLVIPRSAVVVCRFFVLTKAVHHCSGLVMGMSVHGEPKSIAGSADFTFFEIAVSHVWVVKKKDVYNTFVTQGQKLDQLSTKKMAD